MSFNFGVPSQRKARRVENFPGEPVMTMNAYSGEKGKGRKIEFNTKACELLGFGKESEKVAFTYDLENGIYGIVNADQDGIPEEHGIKVTKNPPRTISDKRTFDYIGSLFSLDVSVDNHFNLELLSELIHGMDGVEVYRFTPRMEEIINKEEDGDEQEIQIPSATFNE